MTRRSTCFSSFPTKLEPLSSPTHDPLPPFQDSQGYKLRCKFTYFLRIDKKNCQKSIVLSSFSVTLHRSCPRLWSDGQDSDILRSVIDALFLATRNYHKERQVKNNSRGECYGCCIYSRSVPRANYALRAHFSGCIIQASVGIQSLFVHLSRPW